MTFATYEPYRAQLICNTNTQVVFVCNYRTRTISPDALTELRLNKFLN